MKFKERILTADAIKKIGEEVLLCGWIAAKRDHGKVTFFDLRDREGILQCVVSESQKQTQGIAKSLNGEDVVKIRGLIKERPDNLKNPNIQTGSVELEVKEIEVLSRSKPLPFPIESAGYEINEDLRLKYRYLDLRRERLKKNIKLRYHIQDFIRNFLKNKGFWEIETPILTKATPEGARDFLVPSRLHRGKFYALPQSPQQYKQLLMVAGIEKYFQIARCFRDEDLRKDRLLEFTQLDIEMSFVEEEDILSLTEELVIEVSEKIIGKKIKKKPFPRIEAQECLEKYNTDKPDLREKGEKDVLAYVWITSFPMFERKDDDTVGAVHHPFTAIKKQDLPLLSQEKDEIFKIRAQQYDLVLNGFEVFGGSIRETDPEILKKVFEILSHTKKEVEAKFGHLLEAFGYGVPPHGGIAGFDRWLQAMLEEKSIREVVAFPTSGAGVTSVMEAPTEIEKKELQNLSLKVIKSK